MSTDVKEIVQEKYGEAARRVRTGAGLPAQIAAPRPVAVKAPQLHHATPSPRTFTTRRKQAEYRKKPSLLRSTAAIRPYWLS